MSDSSDDGPGGHEVGSLGEEAAKLLGAFSDWAREQGHDAADGVGHGAADAAAGAAEALRNVGEHLSTGAPECTYCPVCRVVHAVRACSPEVRTHLAVAGMSLVQAASALLATATPHDRRAEAAAEDLEHIDLDDDEWPEH
ncbi:hypothetical protein [Nocardioides donggukensis]|uniref:Uncharacterized protein n=1 Tax=Nocardioides donggukensis TaxID=2774019 RepID=A0A927PZH8_9ACTN|nr:hypothetical protein [Nocardioides donggukensis]MBD8869160.1 hypothetical protein [Nocardioides donggukensis]